MQKLKCEKPAIIRCESFDVNLN